MEQLLLPGGSGAKTGSNFPKRDWGLTGEEEKALLGGTGAAPSVGEGSLGRVWHCQWETRTSSVPQHQKVESWDSPKV